MFRTIFKNHFGLVCLLASLFYCTETIAVENAITNHAPVTSSVNSATLTNTSASIFLVASDADYDNLTYFIVSQPSNGTITLSGANVTYTPNTGFTGTDTFTFKANDSFLDSNVETVTISVFNSYLSQPSQIGQDLVGENSSDLLGNAISFNEDRTIMAIGAKNYANNKGVVKVYKNINGTWSIMGSAIVGSAINMYHGFSIDLSSNGMRLAVGIPGYNNFKGMVRIYEYTNGTWSQMGSDLTFNQDSARFGWSVSFTADAEKIAIGAWGYNNERGAVWFYEYQSSNWEYLAIIQGSSGGIEYGKAIAYSSDGSRLLVGAPNYNIGKGFAKFLRNFNVLDGSLGYNLQSILPFTNSENFGSAVTMSSKGDMVAIAEIAYDNSKGLVRVYRYGTYGLDLIHTFTGQSAGDLFGNSISISSDGKALVIGAPGANSNNGKVSLYRFQNNQWSASGTQLIGQNGEKLGTTVELSSDGTAVAVGAVAYDYEKGVVRVYDLKNNVPEATADTFLVEANSSNNFIDVLANDSDTDGDEIYLVDVSTTGTGSVSITNEGTINYTPAPNFAGIETINYNVSDGIQSSTSTLTVFVLDPTDTFISASNVNAATLKNQQAKIHLVANALLYNAINYVILSNPTNGTLSQNGANVIYTPNPGFLGSDSFSYKASYGSSESEIKTVSIDVIDSFTLTNKQVGDDLVGQNTGDKMGSSVSFNENHTLMAVGAYRLGSNKGKVTLYEFIDNAWQQTSTIEGSANQEGFGYTVDLSASGTKLAVGLIQINNDKGAVRVFEKNSTSWTQIGSDINGVNVNDEFGGSISLSSDGNRIAIGAQYHLQSFGQAKVFEFKNSNWVQLGASITGIDGDNLGKTVSLSSDGTILAVGAPYHNSFSGVVKIFKLTDSEWAPLGNQIEGTPDGLSIIGESISLSSDGQTIATSLNYNIRVYSLINNQWTIVGGDIQPDFSGNMFVSISSDGKTLGVATFIQGSSSECAASVYRLENEAWSQIGETITEELVNGSGVAIDVSSDGTFFAFGSPGYDQSKGLVKVYNLKVNAPVTNDDTATVLEDAVLTSINVVANDTDADGDTITISSISNAQNASLEIVDNKIKVTPNTNYFGPISFKYTPISNGVEWNVTTVSWNVIEVNDPTITAPDNLKIKEDSWTHEKDVLSNDSDADDVLTISSLDFDATKISASIVDNKIQVTTIQDVNGEFEIKYTTNTGSQETLTVTVDAVNDAPIAINTSANVLENSSNNTITLNISDVDGDDLTVLNPTALHGSVTVNSDNTLNYTPNAWITDPDTITYEVSDGELTDSATVTVNIWNVNDAPVATFNSFSTNEDTNYNGQLTATDLDEDTLSYWVKTSAQNGSVDINADGTFTYIPNENFNGTDTFEYEVSDGELTDTEVVTVTVNAVNDAPEATDLSSTFSINEWDSLEINLDNQIFDVDNEVLWFSVESGLDSWDYSIDGNMLTVTNLWVTQDTLKNVVIKGVDTEGLSGEKILPITFKNNVNENVEFSNFNPITSIAEWETKSFTFNYDDPNGDDVTLELKLGLNSAPDFATLVDHKDGSATVTFAPWYDDADTYMNFVVEAREPNGDRTSTAWFHLTVENTNTAPVASNFTSTSAWQSWTISKVWEFHPNISDVQEQDSSLTVKGLVWEVWKIATAVVNGSGWADWTAENNYEWNAKITYQVNDGFLDSNTATINVVADKKSPEYASDTIFADTQGKWYFNQTITVTDFSDLADADIQFVDLFTGDPVAGSIYNLRYSGKTVTFDFTTPNIENVRIIATFTDKYGNTSESQAIKDLSLSQEN